MNDLSFLKYFNCFELFFPAFSGMTRWGSMTFLLSVLEVFWNCMKFDMSHERVRSKWPFGHSEDTRSRFRDDQMGSYDFPVVTTGRVLEFHEV